MMKINFRYCLLTLFTVSLTLNLAAQEKNSFLKKELLISKLQLDGSVDTIDFIKVINGIDKESSFIDQNGNVVNYLSFEDKVVLVNFWFLACPPCIVELSGLDLLNKKVRSEDFEIITLANDSLTDIDATLLSKKDFNFKVVPNTFLVNENSYPLKLLINKQSEIIDYTEIGNVGSNSVSILIKKYLPLVKKELKK